MIHGPNIGHKDDPAFQAKEAGWTAEMALCRERFQKAARFVLSLKDVQGDFARTRALHRYGQRHDVIAVIELKQYVEWVEAGRPKEWPSKERHEPA